MKKFLTKFIAGIILAVGVLPFPLTANATTIDDVANVARQLGEPEELINQAYNEYYSHPEKYSGYGSAEFDAMIARLYSDHGMIYTTAPQNPEPVTFTTAVALTTSEAGAGAVTSAISSGQQATGMITLTAPDGSTFTRISERDFINLSYDEKMNYIRNFTPEQQQVIYDNLTISERRSLMKQLPIDQKVEMVDSMVDFAEQFDINVTVEDLSDDSISMSMRNDDGELIGMANIGVMVDDTGYDRRGSFTLSTALIIIGVILAGVSCRLLKKGDKNE